jgi:hypothetical protein
MRYFGYTLPTTLPTVGIRNIIAKGFTIAHSTVFGSILLLIGYNVIFITSSIVLLRKKKYT